MKAVIIERFGGPEVMEYRDVPTPEVGPDDVLIEVHAVTVNRALDIHVRESGDGRNPVLPLVLGVDRRRISASGAGAATPNTCSFRRQTRRRFPTTSASPKRP